MSMQPRWAIALNAHNENTSQSQRIGIVSASILKLDLRKPNASSRW